MEPSDRHRQTNLRADQIASGASFLRHDKVRMSPLSKRLEFLEEKGLTPAEIQEALRLSMVDTTTTSPYGSSAHTNDEEGGSNSNNSTLRHVLYGLGLCATSAVGFSIRSSNERDSKNNSNVMENYVEATQSKEVKSISLWNSLLDLNGVTHISQYVVNPNMPVQCLTLQDVLNVLSVDSSLRQQLVHLTHQSSKKESSISTESPSSLTSVSVSVSSSSSSSSSSLSSSSSSQGSHRSEYIKDQFINQLTSKLFEMYFDTHKEQGEVGQHLDESDIDVIKTRLMNHDCIITFNIFKESLSSTSRSISDASFHLVPLLPSSSSSSSALQQARKAIQSVGLPKKKMIETLLKMDENSVYPKLKDHLKLIEDKEAGIETSSSVTKKSANDTDDKDDDTTNTYSNITPQRFSVLRDIPLFHKICSLDYITKEHKVDLLIGLFETFHEHEMCYKQNDYDVVIKQNAKLRNDFIEMQRKCEKLENKLMSLEAKESSPSKKKQNNNSKKSSSQQVGDQEVTDYDVNIKSASENGKSTRSDDMKKETVAVAAAAAAADDGEDGACEECCEIQTDLNASSNDPEVVLSRLLSTLKKSNSKETLLQRSLPVLIMFTSKIVKEPKVSMCVCVFCSRFERQLDEK
jgi:hypothetical protein